MSHRKIIQLVIGSSPSSDYAHEVFALCDDETVWTDSQIGRWSKLSPIPQDDASSAYHQARELLVRAQGFIDVSRCPETARDIEDFLNSNL